MKQAMKKLYVIASEVFFEIIYKYLIVKYYFNEIDILQLFHVPIESHGQMKRFCC